MEKKELQRLKEENKLLIVLLPCPVSGSGFSSLASSASVGGAFCF